LRPRSKLLSFRIIVKLNLKLQSFLDIKNTRMNIQIISDNVEVSERYKQIVNDKLQDLDQLLIHFDRDMKYATVKISRIKDKGEFILNFNMRLPGKKHIYADAQDKIFQAAVSKLKAAVESQVRTYKGEIKSY